MMKIDAYATQPHYADHIRSILQEVEPALRGNIHQTPGRWRDFGGPVLVASHRDLVDIRGSCYRPIVLMEHGCGQTYSGAGDAYADGEDRRGVRLYLSPGPWATMKHRQHHPRVPVVEVGYPRLEEMQRIRATQRITTDKPTLAFGWHWDCRVAPETRATWPYWLPHLPRLSSAWTLLGHSHPRAWTDLRSVYARSGIPATPSLLELVRRADVYCVDNSSTAFEMLAVGVPVVLLDHPSWPTKTTHGLRFGAVGDMFDRCRTPEELMAVLCGGVYKSMLNRDAILSATYRPRAGGAIAAAVALERLCGWKH